MIAISYVTDSCNSSILPFDEFFCLGFTVMHYKTDAAYCGATQEWVVFLIHTLHKNEMCPVR
jgi:hypothetical protein